MKRPILLATMFVLAACSTGPAQAGTAYFLRSIDGRNLPTANGLPTGFELVFETLAFPTDWRPRTGDPASGLARITTIVRGPDQRTERSATDHNFTVTGDQIRINLCPSLALCIVSTELVGTLSGSNDLVLTHVLGGQKRSVYHFYLPGFD